MHVQPYRSPSVRLAYVSANVFALVVVSAFVVVTVTVVKELFLFRLLVRLALSES